MDIRSALTILRRLDEGAGWLTQPPTDDLIDIIIDAKIISGEEIDEHDDEVRERVLDEIISAQRDMAPHVRGGKVAVHRAIVVTPEWIDALQPGAELGVSWSYELAGAFPYNASTAGGKVVLVISGVTSEDEVNWAASIAMHASGEAELRLRPDAPVEVTQLAIKQERYGRQATPVRPDLIGEIFRA